MNEASPEGPPEDKGESEPTDKKSVLKKDKVWNESIGAARRLFVVKMCDLIQGMAARTGDDVRVFTDGMENGDPEQEKVQITIDIYTTGVVELVVNVRAQIFIPLFGGVAYLCDGPYNPQIDTHIVVMALKTMESRDRTLFAEGLQNLANARISKATPKSVRPAWAQNAKILCEQIVTKDLPYSCKIPN